MTRKRDYSSEIQEIKSRLHKHGKRLKHVEKRILPLISACLEIRGKNIEDRNVRKELLRYIPIGAISIVEGWFRMAVAELLNRSIICLKNATLLKKIETKFELKYILSIQGKKISAGELIAHILPMNKIEDIVESMTIIIGEDFKEKFKSITISPNPNNSRKVLKKA